MGNAEALMNISPFLSVDQTCGETLKWIKKRLSLAGLRAMQTFDLHTARTALHNCSCPNHGTEDCDCQMVVLLVFGQTEEPATLFLHGNNGQTWLSIADNPLQRVDPELLAQIQQALEAPVALPQNT